MTDQKESTRQIQRLNTELQLKVDEYERLMKELRQSKAELQDKIHDLETFHDVVVGRELKMMELEKDNARLRAELLAAQSRFQSQPS